MLLLRTTGIVYVRVGVVEDARRPDARRPDFLFSLLSARQGLFVAFTSIVL